MHWTASAALLLAAAFGAVGPFVARRVGPVAAYWLLTLGGLLSGVSGVCVLSLLSATLVGQQPELAEGHWSIAVLRRHDPVRLPVAVCSSALVLLSLARLTRVIVRRVAAARATRELSASLVAGGDLVVLPEDGVDAYALPGHPGRIVVTRGALRLLDGAGRRVLLAHERSHLRRRHHRHLAAAAAAAALNPLLQPLQGAQRYAVERSADEDAARVAGRSAVARTLQLLAAVPADPTVRPATSLAAADAAVAGRLNALLGAPPRSQRLWLLIPLQLAVLTLLATVVTASDTVALFLRAGFSV